MENMSNQQQMTPDEARTALGVSTHLMEQMLPQQQAEQQGAPQQEQEGKPQPQEPAAEKPKEEGIEAKVELNMTDKLEEIRKEMKADMQRELDGLKEQITSALAEDQNEPTEVKKSA